MLVDRSLFEVFGFRMGVTQGFFAAGTGAVVRGGNLFGATLVAVGGVR